MWLTKQRGHKTRTEPLACVCACVYLPCQSRGGWRRGSLHHGHLGGEAWREKHVRALPRIQEMGSGRPCDARMASSAPRSPELVKGVLEVLISLCPKEGETGEPAAHAWHRPSPPCQNPRTGERERGDSTRSFEPSSLRTGGSQVQEQRRRRGAHRSAWSVRRLRREVFLDLGESSPRLGMALCQNSAVRARCHRTGHNEDSVMDPLTRRLQRG